MERPNSDSIHQSHERRVKLNVGGKHFETRASTLLSAGPDSLLAALSGRPDDEDPIFIDRDPEIFSVILSLLRTNRLPSSSTRFSKQELADESLYYGVESLLKSAISPPPLSGVDASLVDTIRPAAEAFPTAFTASAVDDGSVWIAHGGGQVSAYDWNLIHTGTIRTHLEEITSIRRVWPDVTAVGSNANTDSDSSGLHFYNLSSGRQIGSVHWIDSSDPRIYKARVWSITDSSDSVFASVDCFHRENCILEVDKTTLQIASEFGRLPGNSTKNTVPTKLIYLQGSGAIMSSAVSSGAFGYSGFIRLWDPRKREMVWETSEPGGSGRSSRFGDSFADMDVDVDESLMFKVCSKSGDLAMADLRYLREDPWVYLEERNPSLRNTGGGENSVVHCYRKQVFLGRKETGLEVWSRVLRKDVKEEQEEEELRDPNCYRRNFVDKEDERGRITMMEGGGERLFVSREGVEGLQVWETSNICGGGGPVSVL